jgi:hypothetical protein
MIPNRTPMRFVSTQSQLRIERQLMFEGSQAFCLGWPIKDCPPFKLEWMTWAWRQGWRNMRDRTQKKAPPKRGQST